MADSVIFNSAYFTLALVVAVALSMIDLTKPLGYVLPILSAVIVVITLTCSLLFGASMQEVLIVAAVFFALNASGFFIKTPKINLCSKNSEEKKEKGTNNSKQQSAAADEEKKV